MWCDDEIWLFLIIRLIFSCRFCLISFWLIVVMVSVIGSVVWLWLIWWFDRMVMLFLLWVNCVILVVMLLRVLISVVLLVVFVLNVGWYSMLKIVYGVVFCVLIFSMFVMCRIGEFMMIWCDCDCFRCGFLFKVICSVMLFVLWIEFSGGLVICVKCWLKYLVILFLLLDNVLIVLLYFMVEIFLILVCSIGFIRKWKFFWLWL